MHILMIGDVVGSTGRRLLKDKLPNLKKIHQIDLCIANGENAAAGLGLTPRLAQEINEMGVDLITLGNHTWSKRELVERIDLLNTVIRPANGPAEWPGVGWRSFKTPQGLVVVINLLGRIFMEPLDCPFRTADQIIEHVKTELAPVAIFVDFHAEATAEKMAMGYYLNGRVAMVAGTHTHVQTADEQILNRGTAYITDVGMTGPIHGIIGMNPESSLHRFINHMPAPYEAATGLGQLSAVVVSVDSQTGKAQTINRISIKE
ncbi:MAG: TIGR00282 family metallophosphoesterase [Eubacteriales bacterium]|nr:TIGR00282 family metallophosphoesterase [Eubacteriales bacterium]